MPYPDKDREPPTPSLMFVEEDKIVAPNRLKLGDKLPFAHNGFDDWIVDAVTGESTAGTEYRISRISYG